MNRAVPIVRIIIVAVAACMAVLTSGDPRLLLELARVAGQAPVLLPGQASPDDTDMTPAERSAEVQALLLGTSFTPDLGEPAGAVKVYLATQETIRKAARRIEEGPAPGEVDFDPYQLLNEVVAMRRRATELYPSSRCSWQGLAELLWQQYIRQHRSSDLREAVGAYVNVADILTARVQQNLGGGNVRDFVTAVRAIANGLAALQDQKSLDGFFVKLQGTTAWPLARLAYAVALGALNDRRADQLFQEELRLMPPDETVLAYVDYLWDQGRYRDALAILDRRDRARLNAILSVHRGAILERLGRLDEARTEYQHYVDEALRRSKSAWQWPLVVSDRYRIGGSTLQRNIKFYPSVDAVPRPQSGLWPLLLPSVASADHVSTPCASDDWNCKAYWYLVRSIHGEAGCVNTMAGCWGTMGGQRAVAWNLRHRVFYGLGDRRCPNREVCFNYASNFPLVNNPADSVALARRYYYVADQGYVGVQQSMSEAERIEAEGTGYDVLVYGKVPDPNDGRCLAGAPTGDACSGGCSAEAGSWDSILPTGSVEFKGGQVVWQTAKNSTCQWEELVPSGSPTGVRCGKECFLALWWGATCPKLGWLQTRYCSSTQPTWGPVHGNFYWRFNSGGGAGDQLGFHDVPVSHPLYTWVMAVAGARIDLGCVADGTYFCPDLTITRGTMAGWLLRAIHGGSYQPPPSAGIFADVSLSDPAAPWLEQLWREGITSGCGSNPPMYCPSAGVTRGQMAVFLLRAKYGAGYQPPPAAGIFTDVPINHVFARWIERLAWEGITGGCSAEQYCPDAVVSRGQMAVFVARGFNLPL